MPNTQKDHLVILIHSLTKAEKRNFRLLIQRFSGNEQAKFIQLFDYIEKQSQGAFNENDLFSKVPDIKKSQLSNLKAHLYKQILSSLRHLHITHDIDIELRDTLDHATIMYNKGLYNQALKALKKARTFAIKSERYLKLLEVLEFETRISVQFASKNLSHDLTSVSEIYNETLKKVDLISRLSIHSFNVYQRYLKNGFAKNRDEVLETQQFFNQDLPVFDLNTLGFTEKLQLYNAYVWYYFIVQDFAHSYKYAVKWVELFRIYPEQIHFETEVYIKGRHILLMTLFNLRYYEKFVVELDKFLTVDEKNLSSENLRMLYLFYKHINRINKVYLEGNYQSGLEWVPEIEGFIKDYKTALNSHRVILLYYKIACMYFGKGDFKKSIEYLNKVVNEGELDFRHDVQSFSRILRLIAYYELGDEDLVEYQVKSVYRFLIKMGDMQKVQVAILKFIRRLPLIEREELNVEFVALHADLVEISVDPYEKRPFFYLDIISWLESKIHNLPVQEIVQRKFKKERKSGNKYYFPKMKRNKLFPLLKKVK